VDIYIFLKESTLKFCEKCGLIMIPGTKGYQCNECGYIDEIKNISYKVRNKSKPEPVYFVKEEREAITVNRKCSSCGNNEAYRYTSITMGEHAGVKSERSLERYRCTKCGNTWIDV
jgi:DNA-directed RNA polymerase subunit M/transcription elongation factor TFIIS